MDSQIQRICRHCQRPQLSEQFYFKVNRFDGTCKTCRRDERKKRYKGTVRSDEEKAHNQTFETSQNVVDGLGTASKKPSLLTPEDIQKIAEALLILESWQVEADTQGELSNSKLVQPNK